MYSVFIQTERAIDGVKKNVWNMINVHGGVLTWKNEYNASMAINTENGMPASVVAPSVMVALKKRMYRGGGHRKDEGESH